MGKAREQHMHFKLRIWKAGTLPTTMFTYEAAPSRKVQA